MENSVHCEEHVEGNELSNYKKMESINNKYITNTTTITKVRESQKTSEAFRNVFIVSW